ncbi:hypothetical protein GJ689_15515 [Rhodoplanes serenus]|uniref:Uncharacterized protein n=1 Tax=Rhodoplanes serenus TaxID=200615 RepID=A0A9X5AU59_9BRAD|nr:hypothetical protein [Rhodoplanes serenus]MTW17613.1 hypothetical protein [Rhodoplanes serenus]
MPFDIPVLLPLLTKMAVTAAFVVTATATAERAGPLLGAMIATLPVSAGPAYVFLALDHDAAFIAASGLSSLKANAPSGLFGLVFVYLAQSRGVVVSVGTAFLVWAAATVAIQAAPWGVGTTSAVVFAVMIGCAILAAPYGRAPIPLARRRWWDVPVRAMLVATLVGLVVTGSSRLGAGLTGLLSVFPVVLSSMAMILQPRLGGPATAALMAHALVGLIGFAASCLTVHLAVPPLGVWPGLAAALAVSVAFNLVVLLLRRRPTAPARR